MVVSQRWSLKREFVPFMLACGGFDGPKIVVGGVWPTLAFIGALYFLKINSSIRVPVRLGLSAMEINEPLFVGMAF